MSKNVAVFVDVANIFYAAKAAGVDIDYVTLLKSATAGRDFVRAYAYTGLDPENENQRQFHAFLSRSGYKVVSKDIRKYGDGRIKANLDIELVVDMMRMAEKLDVAVVVSGDGDFAPAIYAVQQQGVRVEVISFRGNTSSDLIDAADVFIDIANVAKVEKGARSGRRVAIEGDLSMTEVPDKESGVTPRRRRRREEDERPARRSRAARDGAPRDAEAASAAVSQGALVALPGERLSRGAEVPDVLPPDDDEVESTALADERVGDEGEAGAGRRRRRRRGGRGRGRGGRADEQADAPDEAVERPGPEHPDEVPTLPQHSGFGSVWDSQIGVPVDTATTAGSGFPEDEDTDTEPEVPEYLLTEQRRQQSRRRGGRGGRGGQGGGYRSAIDRERYGVGGAAGYGRGPARGPSQPSRAMPPRSSTPEPAPRRSSGGDPWSEVPPEVQELLRAELARREGTRPGAAAPATDSNDRAATKPDGGPATDSDDRAATPQAAAPAEARPARTTRRKPATKPSADPASGEVAEARPKRTRRSSTTSADASAAAAPDEAEAPTEAKPKRTTRRKATTKAAPDSSSDAAEETRPKRARRSSSTVAAGDGEDSES